MNIGIIGWWHQDNQGDRAILENMARALSPHRLVPIDAPFYLNEDVLRRLNLLDFLILGGGGLFQYGPHPPFDTFDLWAAELRTPIGVAGLGIDSMPPQYQPAANALADRARFFYVRDRSSQEIMNHPKVQLAPDLSFLYPLPQNSKKEAIGTRLPVCGVNLRRLPHLDVGPWVQALRGLPLHLQAIPLTTHGPAQEIQILRQLDETCPQTYDATRYVNLDLMVGMAFHSVVFAIQAAVPVIAIAYAPKVRRFMAETGLEHLVLEPDEWHRLPDLVECLLGEHIRLVDHLCEATRALKELAWQPITSIRHEIEKTGSRRAPSGPKVSVVIVETESDAANRITVESCLSQTYDNLEVVLIGDRTPALPASVSSALKVKRAHSNSLQSLGSRLNQALEQTSGEYLSWVIAGSFFALDAIDCMVDRLQQEPDCDMVFADYYSVGDRERILDIHPVDLPYRLLRRDVVGPCFVIRRRLTEVVGGFRVDTPLVAYDYWLRAHKLCALQPAHVPLFYEQASGETARTRQAERQARRQWRSARPWPVQAFWRIVDTDLVESWAVCPLLAIRRRLRGALGKPNR